MKYRAGLACVAVRCLLSGISCQKTPSPQESQEQQAATLVTTAEVTVGRIVNTISATGTVFAIRETRIRPKVSGLKERVNYSATEYTEHTEKYGTPE